MRDRLENFVMEHRDQLDIRQPDPNIWSRIDQRLTAIFAKTDELENFIQSNREHFDARELQTNIWNKIEGQLIEVDSEQCIEEFVSENRDQFDSKIPNLKVWSKIDQQLGTSETVVRHLSVWRIVGYAASMIFLLSVGAMAGFQFSQSNASEAASLDTISPEYAEMEQYYQKQINRKHAKLASYEYDATVNEDLSQVDDVLDELRVELQDTPKGNEEQIVNAMIKNYKTKIAILEIVLNKIESTNQKKLNKNEAISM